MNVCHNGKLGSKKPVCWIEYITCASVIKIFRHFLEGLIKIVFGKDSIQTKGINGPGPLVIRS